MYQDDHAFNTPLFFYLFLLKPVGWGSQSPLEPPKRAQAPANKESKKDHLAISSVKTTEWVCLHLIENKWHPHCPTWRKDERTQSKVKWLSCALGQAEKW